MSTRTGRAVRFALAMIVAAAVTAGRPAWATRVSVSVTVDAFRNIRSGQIFACIDPVPFGCDRGDFYAIMTLRGADGQSVDCGTTAPTINFDNLIPPGWTCTAAGSLVDPATFIIEVWDFDGRSLNALDGDDPVDIGAGYRVPSTFAVPLGTTTTTTTGDNGTITVTMTATTVPVTLTAGTPSSPSIDPRLGETTSLRFDLGAPDPSVMVSARILDASGSLIVTLPTPAVGPGGQGSFVAQWDGRYGGGLVSPATFQFQVSATDGTTTASATRNVDVIARPDTLRLGGLDTSLWWLTSGPLRATVFATSPTAGELAVYQGENCEPANRIFVLANQTWTGTTVRPWNGVFTSGPRVNQPIGNGRYMVGLRSGPGGSLANGCLPVEVVSPPGLRLYIEADPAVPVDGGGAVIRVIALADDNTPRRTGAISIFVANETDLAARTVPTTGAVAVCPSASTCSAPAPPPVVATATERFGYRAFASDTPVGGITVPPPVNTQWHVSHRTTMATLAAPVDSRPSLTAGVVQQTFGTFDLSRAMDVGFRPGTGYLIGTAAGWLDWMNAVRAVRRTMFGLPTDLGLLSSSTPPGVSALASSPEGYSQWVIPRPVTVAPRIFSSNPSLQFCTTDSWNTGTFDAVGALHLTGCRDMASSLSSPVYFTANNPSVAWHELHHALYGLADEYDGRSVYPLGFDLPAPPRNVYDSPPGCASDPLGTAAGACTEISANFPGMPFAPSGRFRLDPNDFNDVMFGNGPLEQAADVRRVRERLTICRAGGC